MWQEILKERGLIDPKKIKRALNLEKEPQFAGNQNQIPKFDPYGEEGEYANVTDSNLLDVEFENKTIRVKGDITVDGETIPFSAFQRLPKPFVAMSKLPYNLRQFQISSVDIPKKFLEGDEESNFKSGIRAFIGEELAYYFNGIFRYFEEDMDYEYKDFFRTSQGLKSGREDDYGDVRYDKRSKRESFKDVLRKPDSSNVKEFDEIMSKSWKEFYIALPINENIVRGLVKRDLLSYDEKDLERNSIPYHVTKKGENMDIGGTRLTIYPTETFNSNDPKIRIKDVEGEYDLSVYASFDRSIDKIRGEVSSAERQKVIDDYKAFKKMTGKQILDEIMR